MVPPPPPPNPPQPIQTLHISTEQRAARCWIKWHHSRHISLSSASHCADARWWTCGSLTSWHICVPSILTPGHAANPVLHHRLNLLYLLNSFTLYAGGERTSLHFWEKSPPIVGPQIKIFIFGWRYIVATVLCKCIRWPWTNCQIWIIYENRSEKQSKPLIKLCNVVFNRNVCFITFCCLFNYGKKRRLSTFWPFLAARVTFYLV